MFKDELIALQEKANPRNDNLQHIVAEFKETIKNWVKDGFCRNENKVSFDIVKGKIRFKNHKLTCSIEDLSAVEKVFKKEGINMHWTYDRTHLNGTLTFKW